MYAGPIIDSHYHVFLRADTPQFVLLSAAVVQRDFSLDDYRTVMGAANVIGGVVMQAADVGTGMDELAYIERQPADPLIGRYVGYLPLTRRDAPDIVAQLARHPLVAGVRFSQLVDEKGALVDRSATLEALHALAEYNIVYELSIRPWQYAGLLDIAAAAPATTFVLGHLGKPRVTTGYQADWYSGMERLATLPNVVCKVSVPLEGPEDPPSELETLQPLIRHAVDCFGYDRVMFGSNFPVNFISVSCAGWLAMLHECLAYARADELDRLYRRNAARIYRMSPEPYRASTVCP